MNTFENDLSLYPEFDEATEGFKDVVQNVGHAIGSAASAVWNAIKAFGAWIAKQMQKLIEWGRELRKKFSKSARTDAKSMRITNDIIHDIESMCDGVNECLINIISLRKVIELKEIKPGVYATTNTDSKEVAKVNSKMAKVLKISGETVNKLKELPTMEATYENTKIIYNCLKDCLDNNRKLTNVLNTISHYDKNRSVRRDTTDALLDKFASVYGHLSKCVIALNNKIKMHESSSKNDKDTNESKEQTKNQSNVSESADIIYESILSKVYEDMYDKTEESVNILFDELDAANEKAIDYDDSLYKTRFNPSKFVITPDALKNFGIPSDRADELFDALCDYMAEKEYITWGKKELHEKIAEHFKETRKITAKEITEFGWRYFNKAAKLLKKATKEGNIDATDIIKKANKKVLQSTNVSLAGKAILEFLGCCVAGAIIGIGYANSFAPLFGPAALTGGRIIMGGEIINGGLVAASNYSKSKRSLNKIASRSSGDEMSH